MWKNAGEQMRQMPVCLPSHPNSSDFQTAGCDPYKDGTIKLVDCDIVKWNRK